MGRGGYTHEKSEKRINVPSAARPSTDTKRQIAPTPKELVQQVESLSCLPITILCKIIDDN